jgi:hypothetical protein
MISVCLLHAHFNFSLCRQCSRLENTGFFSKTVYGTSLVITSGSAKENIWPFARYHKWQHRRQYMALRSLSQVAAPKTVYGPSLVITNGSTKDSIWHFARYHKWQRQRQYMALRSLSQVAAPKKEFYFYRSRC